MLLLLDLLSTLCFACVGALIGLNAGLRAWRVGLAALLTAVGGGTIREITLGSELFFWLENPAYLAAICLAVPVAVFIFRLSLNRVWVSRCLESAATAVFILVGSMAAKEAGCDLPGTVLAGTCTGIGGGILRQLLLESNFNVGRNAVNLVAAVATALVCLVLGAEIGNTLAVFFALGLYHFIVVELTGSVLTRLSSAGLGSTVHVSDHES